ncbi:hypothetical protein CK203_102781 [Vitis vinifera]|uniref:DUF4283 domain-containing protein n=1 Tax=Vitis vinifera TaxID=29760 RepID=A0A438D666_VITVI|nr:hypothetical protein CK203_102781 [Vitis vinifera]
MEEDAGLEGQRVFLLDQVWGEGFCWASRGEWKIAIKGSLGSLSKGCGMKVEGATKWSCAAAKLEEVLNKGKREVGKTVWIDSDTEEDGRLLELTRSAEKGLTGRDLVVRDEEVEDFRAMEARNYLPPEENGGKKRVWGEDLKGKEENGKGEELWGSISPIMRSFLVSQFGCGLCMAEVPSGVFSSFLVFRTMQLSSSEEPAKFSVLTLSWRGESPLSPREVLHDRCPSSPSTVMGPSHGLDPCASFPMALEVIVKPLADISLLEEVSDSKDRKGTTLFLKRWGGSSEWEVVNGPLSMVLQDGKIALLLKKLKMIGGETLCKKRKKKTVSASRSERELKRLDCTVSYGEPVLANRRSGRNKWEMIYVD